MSYRGYEEVLCERGHLHWFDWTDLDEEIAEMRCHTFLPLETNEYGIVYDQCDALFGWIHSVDLTNGEDLDDPGCTEVPPSKVLDDHSSEPCPHCHQAILHPRRYAVPPTDPAWRPLPRTS